MNQAKRRAEPTAADGVAPVDVDAGDANGQEEGMAGPSNAPTIPGKGGNVQNFKELAPAAKPEMKYTKRSKERDEIQLKMLTKDPKKKDRRKNPKSSKEISTSGGTITIRTHSVRKVHIKK